MKYLNSEEFLKKAEIIPVVDVRSPAEYSQGHIPGAINIPLFSDEERSRVGTAYKSSGRQDAVLLGLELVAPRMASLARQAAKIAASNKLLVHCWRGGMRSESMAWLFETTGVECEVLSGGYKSYRSHIRENITGNKTIIILGGLTGSGKTLLLNEMKEIGEPVIDLEGIANHKGSAFGGIGQPEQPSSEHFENLLYEEVKKITEPYFWVEDESMSIGRVFIPNPFYERMLQSKILFISVPDQHRIKILVDEYAGQDPGLIREAIMKLEKRLGNLAARQAADSLAAGDFGEAARILLKYYDKTYSYGLGRKKPENVHHLDLTGLAPEQYPEAVIKQKEILLGKKS